jgi:hypothetical protein
MLYNKLKTELLKGTIDLVNDTIKVMLLTSSYTPNIDTNLVISDISANEITGAGYTAGGSEITGKTVTQDDTDNEGVFDGDDVNWSTSTITARYAVIYKDSGTPSTSPLFAYVDFGADKSSLNENFIVSWATEGILNLN